MPCRGINHADFSADLTSILISCEFTGQLLVLDADVTAIRSVIDLNHLSTPGATSPADSMSMPGAMGGPAGWLQPGASSMPQDVRLAPDGTHFLVADMLRNGVWVINAATMAVDHFVPTGKGAHGIYPSRDAGSVYVSNRDEGSITVLDAATLSPARTWKLPGGGSPDMGGVTADGTQLWLSGRYNSTVYVIDTVTGSVAALDPGPRRPPRAPRLAPTRPVLPRTHRKHAVNNYARPSHTDQPSSATRSTCQTPRPEDNLQRTVPRHLRVTAHRPGLDMIGGWGKGATPGASR